MQEFLSSDRYDVIIDHLKVIIDYKIFWDKHAAVFDDFQTMRNLCQFKRL